MNTLSAARGAASAILTVAVLVVTAVAPASAEAAQPGNYLVAVPGDAADFRDDVVAAGGTVQDVYGGIDVLAVTLPPAAAAELDRRAGVEVEPPFQVGISDEASYGLDRIDQRNLPLSQTYARPSTGLGEGVDVYVMDTGIRADHQQFGGRVLPGFTAVDDGNGTGDCNGHGTHVAGTVAGQTVGVAPLAHVIPVRILNCSGTTTTGYEFTAGLDWIIQNHQAGRPAVLNLSLGGPASPVIDDAIAAVQADGIAVVAAAGNQDGDACKVSPARAPAALAVAASTITDARAAYSDYGPCVDLFAPGGDSSAPIVSAGIGSATRLVGMAGTSMASPHVAGAAARYLSLFPRATPGQVDSALIGSSTPDVISGAGPGTPNRLLYVGGTLSAAGTAISAEFDLLGGPGGVLGFPTGPETCGLTGNGCYRSFQHGEIHWSPASGAHYTTAAIASAWGGLRWENGSLGYPTSDPSCGSDGRCVQSFQGGQIYAPATGPAFAVAGGIGGAFRRTGGAAALGFPTSAEHCGLRDGGCFQYFEKAQIHWSPGSGAHPTQGAVRSAWGSHGWENGSLGYPTSDPACGSDGRCAQQFQHGELLGGGSGVFWVKGGIGGAYLRAGAQTGTLGYPTSNEICGIRNGGCYQYYENGQIHWSPTSGAYATRGGVRNVWGGTGWENGPLGYPTSGLNCGLRAGGCLQFFQGGAVYTTGAGSFASYGGIRSLWASRGWENGSLGYPTGNERCTSTKSECTQTYENGTIVWTPTTGARIR